MSKRPGYGDSEAKRIIERAAQIDAEQAQRVDASALREIAAEAGISRLAVDRALQEYETTTPARVPWLRRHRTTVVTMVAVAAMMTALLLGRLVP